MGYAPFDNPDFASLAPDLDAMVRGELAGDEKLVWAGRPRVGRMVLASLPVLAFGIFFGGFAVFWMIMASAAPAPFALFGLPFVAVGLAMLASPFWAGHKASRTYYALTDRRAILCEPDIWHGLQVRSYLPVDLRRLWRSERADGSGDLIFEETTSYGHRGRRNVTRRGFLAIDDVRTVEALIRSTFPETLGVPGRMKFDLESR